MGHVLARNVERHRLRYRVKETSAVYNPPRHESKKRIRKATKYRTHLNLRDPVGALPPFSSI